MRTQARVLKFRARRLGASHKVLGVVCRVSEKTIGRYFCGKYGHHESTGERIEQGLDIIELHGKVIVLRKRPTLQELRNPSLYETPA